MVGVLFLQEPGFGDDFTYWRLAFHLHESGSSAWSAHSFHDLRWPVWGWCWFFQGLFGPGLISYYAVPLLYLSAGAAIVFAFARRLVPHEHFAWLAVSLFLFTPLLDPVVFRPMPDLPEALFGAAVLLTWWRMMEASDRATIIGSGAISGLSIGLAYASRVTGVFIAPVLAIATLCFYRPRWRRLMMPAAVALAYFAADCFTYHAICGEWLHGITANSANCGVKGTEPLTIWQLPIRFLPGFWHGNRLAPFFSVLALVGLWAGWCRHGMTGRVVVLWFGVLFLEYTCSIQSLHPLRPLIGTTPRYLVTLIVPFALLVSMGALRLIQWSALIGWRPFMQTRNWLLQHGKSSLAVLALILLGLTGRPLFSLGYVKAARAHLRMQPPETKIFSHEAMRDLAFLVDPWSAQRIAWVAPRSILAATPRLEAAARDADELWFLRKLLWLNERKATERTPAKAPPAIAAYLAHPEQDWLLNDVIAKGAEPELVYYRRRPPQAPAPHFVEATSPILKAVAPALPIHWLPSSARGSVEGEWNIPKELRGRFVRLEARGTSSSVEPFNVKLRFHSSGHKGPEYLFKPIFHASESEDFLALGIPADADRCEFRMVPNGHPKEVTITSLRLVYDDVR